MADHDHSDEAPAAGARAGSPKPHIGHGHSHGAPTPGLAFAVGIGLNTIFVAVELAYGAAAHSVALVADAAHNMTDVLGLCLAWGAATLAKQRPSRRRTYGLRRSTILATLGNATLLLLAVGGVVWEAVGRLRSPGPVEGATMLWVAAVGVVINGVSALFFFRGKDHDANIRGAFLHLAADAAVSLGVVIAGALILKTHWLMLDPLVSIVISGVILVSTWSLLKDALNLALDAVPPHIDPEAVLTFLGKLPAVQDVHDLHIWAMSTTEVALTAHLRMPWDPCPPAFLENVGRELHDRFGIEHSTIQIEPVEDGRKPCAQGSGATV